jgi:hypothetical protein
LNINKNTNILVMNALEEWGGSGAVAAAAAAETLKVVVLRENIEHLTAQLSALPVY